MFSFVAVDQMDLLFGFVIRSDQMDQIDLQLDSWPWVLRHSVAGADRRSLVETWWRIGLHGSALQE